MTIRRILGFLITAMMIAEVPALAEQTQAPPKPEPKPAAAPSVAGKWILNVESPNGAIESNLELKADPKDPKKVSGTIASPMGEAPIDGTFVDGTLSLVLKMDSNGTPLTVNFTGKLQKDDTLAGTYDFGQGAMNWTGKRVKSDLTLTGTWAMALEMQVGTSTPTLILNQDGTTISGAYEGRYGKFPVTGVLTGRSLQFTFKMSAEGADVVMAFKAEVSEDFQSLRGTADMSGAGEATWTAKRK